MRLARPALIVGTITGGVVLWTGAASVLFAWLGHVPIDCWFYYALPWPDDFLWDGAYLTLSGCLAAAPFVLAARLFADRWRRRGTVYGTTGWATPKQMHDGGLRLRGKL